MPNSQQDKPTTENNDIFRIIIKSNRIKSYQIVSNRIKMGNGVYYFKLNIDWKLINLISDIDCFDANWTATERKEGQILSLWS
jgi:hypothetical protein